MDVGTAHFFKTSVQHPSIDRSVYYGLHSYTGSTYIHTYTFTIIMVYDSETYVGERLDFRDGTFEYKLWNFEA